MWYLLAANIGSLLWMPHFSGLLIWWSRGCDNDII